MKNNWTIKGETTEIFLSHKGSTLICVIDTKDLDKVRSFPGTWFVKWNNTARTFYVRNNGIGRKRVGATYLHRFLLGISNPDVPVDHDDHNGLNNRRRNLKVSTVEKNGFNRQGAQRNTKSKLRNVYWNEREQQWMVWAQYKGRIHYAGYFKDLDKADKAAHNLRARIRRENNL